MAVSVSLLKAFASGNGIGSISAYFTYAQDLDANFTALEATVNALVSEVTSVQGPNALLPRDMLEINDPLHAGGTQSSGVIGGHSFLTAVGIPTTNLNVARGQALIGGSRVSVLSDTVFAGSGTTGTRWVNLRSTGALSIQTSAGTGGLDIASVTWTSGGPWSAVVWLASIFADGDDYDLQRRRLAAIGGASPTFPITTYRAVNERLTTLERILAGYVTGAIGETLGQKGFGGAVGTPGLILTDGTTFDQTSGLFRPAANVLGVAISGSEVLRVVAAQIAAAIAGSAAAPAFTRSTDLNTGIYFPAADELSIAAGGDQAQTFARLAAGVVMPSSATRPRVRTSRTGLALASGAALVALAANTEDEDVGGWVAATSADHTVPAGADGLYLIQGGVTFLESSAGGTNENTGNVRRVALTVGGVEIPGSGQFLESRGNNALTEDFRLAAFALIPLAAGNVVRIAAAQDSGASMNVDFALRIVPLC